MNQTQAFDIMNTGVNVFLTGKAGTGKSWLTNEFIKHQRQQGKFVVVLAPTGVAAINIGGATIHSTFKMFGTYLYFRPIKSQVVDWKDVDTIIIDEISMVGPDYIDYIDHILKKERGIDKPFGGVQMIFVGDKAQLPPVYVANDDIQKKELSGLRTKYGELTFDKADAYIDFQNLNLEEIKRQSDPEFIEILNCLRAGDRSALSQLKTGYGDDETVHLKPFNTMVDKHNTQKFQSLPGKIECYDAYITGEFNIKNAITPIELFLKVGARVMVTKNLENGLVNGDMATVKSLHPGYVVIHSDRFDSEFEIEEATWKEIRYEGNEEKEIGSMKQIPLKLAWAITIHKCIEGNQRVYTNNGLIPIKDIRKGDLVISDDGNYNPVTLHTYTGKKKLLKLTTSIGRSILITPEHKMFMANGSYQKSKDLIVGDQLVIDRTILSSKNLIPISLEYTSRMKEIHLPEYIDSHFAYYIGAIIGDGSYNYDHDGRIDFTKYEGPTLQKVRDFYISAGINFSETVKKGCTTLVATSSPLRNYLRSIGLDNSIGKDKVIPHVIMESGSTLVTKYMLAGLFDTDGSASNKRITYCSTSEKLIDQMQLLLLSFGIISYKKNITTGFHLYITGPSMEVFMKTIPVISYKFISIKGFTSIKTNNDFVFNSQDIIEEFRSLVGYIRDIRDLLKKGKRLSYKNVNYLFSIAKDKGIHLPIAESTLYKNHFYDAIVSIEDAGEGDTYDIEVYDRHSFVCEGLVTHNSQGLTLDNVCITVTPTISKDLLYVGVSRATSMEKLYIHHSS